jgi:ankyrin repeat/BTB/POZ domain-containing protein 1
VTVSHFVLLFQVFMCGRSDYFKAFLLDHFSEAVSPELTEYESRGEKSIPEWTLHDVSAEVFAAVLAFIYQDSAEVLETYLYLFLYTVRRLLFL